MPWSEPNQFELSEEGIMNAPAASGVFGLSKPGAWVYIASSNNIRQALVYYLNGNMPWIMQQKPVNYSFEQVEGSDCTSRCSELTAEYRPVFLNCV